MRKQAAWMCLVAVISGTSSILQRPLLAGTIVAFFFFLNFWLTNRSLKTKKKATETSHLLLCNAYRLNSLCHIYKKNKMESLVINFRLC